MRTPQTFARPASLRALLPLFLALPLAACETMESSGSIFEPVEVSSSPVESADETEPEGDSRFDLFNEQIVISSEDLSAMADAEAAGQPVPDLIGGTSVEETTDDDDVADAQAESDGANAAPSATPDPISTAAPTQMAGFVGFSAQAGGWPLRLVGTVADAQPPRAILGLPDGREVVVSPGTMVPEVGVVVMSVGRSQVEVARVTPAGDHALVSSQTLSAQF